MPLLFRTSTSCPMALFIPPLFLPAPWGAVGAVLNYVAVVIAREHRTHLTPDTELCRCRRADCRVEPGVFLYELAVA